MILYLDSSAYIKNYILEPGRNAVLHLMRAADIIATHELALVEISSAFERAYREKRLDAEQLHQAHMQFDEDWPATLVITTNNALHREADRLVRQFPLKAYDAMHLAAACALREVDGLETVFAGFDGQQNRAARQLGLNIPETLD